MDAFKLTTTLKAKRVLGIDYSDLSMPIGKSKRTFTLAEMATRITMPRPGSSLS